jgi:cell shape-determining protein MreC
MKISFILLSIVFILSIFSISHVYAQSASSNNTLRACVDAFMGKFDQALAKLDQNLQKRENTLNASENNSTFLKTISTDACVSSYTETGKFGHLLSVQDQEKFVTASLFKLMMEAKNKLNK